MTLPLPLGEGRGEGAPHPPRPSPGPPGQEFDPAHLCPLTTQAALDRAATLAPDVEALVTPTARLTYAQLQTQTAETRNALAALGIRHGDHIGLLLGNSPHFVTLFLALGSLGAITIPINTRLKPEEIAYALHQARVTTLFAADTLLRVDVIAMLRAIEPAIDHALPGHALPHLARLIVIGEQIPAAALSWDRFRAAQTPTPPACRPEDTLLIQYTSGTTARPKGVLLQHRSMLGNGFVSGARMGLRPGDRFHSARPFFHVAGTSLSILACIQHAATLVTMERFEPGQALALLESERCTHVSGNDTMALMLLNHPDRARRRLHLRGAWAAASPAIIRRIVDELGARECVVGYGLSEASPNVAQSCWWEPEHIRVAALMTPQPGVEIRISPTGEIQVRGYTVMQGYWDKPEETAAALDAEGWLSTGDLGRLHPDGRLEFTGRAKDIIRVGGENVSPAEIEDTLNRHPAIRQAVVVGVPDPRLTEVPCAFLILNEGHTHDGILDWARTRMAGFKVPRHLQVVETFESIGMTASSKIQKIRLRAHAISLLGLG